MRSVSSVAAPGGQEKGPPPVMVRMPCGWVFLMVSHEENSRVAPRESPAWRPMRAPRVRSRVGGGILGCWCEGGDDGDGDGDGVGVGVGCRG